MNKDMLIEEDFKSITSCNSPWLNAKNSSFLIIGATGLVGTSIVKYLLYLNDNYHTSYNITVMARNIDKIKKIYGDNKKFNYLLQDVRQPLNNNFEYNYIIDCASNADPRLYAINPVETINTNVQGVTNILEYCRNHINTKFIFLSSVEVYGNTNAYAKPLTESDFGYTDCNTVRACYTESKRLSETLCKAYCEQYGVNSYIARLCKIYGPYVTDGDTKVMAQMLRKVVANENIILKSNGMQTLSFCYSIDVVSALLYILTRGKISDAYNVSDKNSVYKLKEVADMLSKIGNVDIEYQLPTDIEKKGYSVIKDAILNSNKLEELGWNANINMATGLEHSVKYLKKNNI